MRQGPGPLTEDAALRAIVHANPRDELAWSVWADALEARGETIAATVVRRAFALRSCAPRDALDSARALLDLAAPLSRAWLAQLTPPADRLDGSVWGARDTDGSVYLVAFADDGTIHFVQGDEGMELPASAFDAGKGTWMQIDRALAFSIYAAGPAAGPTLADFSRQEGVILDVGARIAGIGSDRDDKTWRWELARRPADEFQFGYPLPQLPEDPHDVETTAVVLLGERRWR